MQRVTWAEFEVEGEVLSRIERGFVVLLGVATGDAEPDAEFVAGKLAGLRLFGDAEGKMNLSLLELDPPGAVLCIPNFTLLGDARRGRRPSFAGAAPPEEGRALWEDVCLRLEARGVPVARGVFGAHMHVRLENDGPVTLVVESPRSVSDVPA